MWLHVFQKTNAEKWLSLKLCYNCVKKRILLSQFYYKFGKNKGSIYFQSVCEAVIVHIVFLARQKTWLPHFWLAAKVASL